MCIRDSPQTVGQIPVYYGHKPSGGRSHWKGDYVETSAKPLYPFGYGLSYTRFEYANLRVAPPQVRAGATVTVQADIANTGARAGDEVVQLYVNVKRASVTRPVKELKGFARLTLEPGETRTVTFELAVNQLAYLDRAMRRVIEPGPVEVMVAASADDVRLSGSFEIVGEAVPVEPAFFSRVSVR